MAWLTTAPRYFLLPPRLVGDLNFPAVPPPLAAVLNPRRCRQQQRPHPAVCFDLESSSFGVGNFKIRHYEGCWCKGWESEGDLALEAEILEFMTKSEKPEVFPTKEELVDGGRMDLVEAIVKKGGWLSLGWDLGNDNREVVVEERDVDVRDSGDKQLKAQQNGIKGEDCDVGVVKDFQRRVESDSNGVSSVSANSSQSPTSSDRSLEMGDEQETGIEGILTRLEKQRNLSFGIDLGGDGYSAHALSKHGGEDSQIETSKYVDSADLGKSTRLISGIPNGGMINNTGSKFNHSKPVSVSEGSRSSLKPDMWQTWSNERAGFSSADFEAAEISFNDNQVHEGKDASKDELLAITGGSPEAWNKQKDVSHNEIRTRLQHLELELTSALCLLRSKSGEHDTKEGHETSNDLLKLSDAWEFQETEIMNTQDRLRSIRAKLAVLEGKMTLAIIDAQKIVEEKQKRIDGARTTLQLLRTSCIVWPNSASEVLLVGSFDGWTTQRKMEKSSTGIFSVCLKLYPGRYEIKFIVDGIWQTDPLRPVVRNNGYENNLLIIM